MSKDMPAWGSLSYQDQEKIRYAINPTGLSKQQHWTQACSVYELIRAMIAERNKS